MRPPGPPGRCQAVLVSPTAAPVYSTARPARTAPPLCCGTAAACGLGLRPLALGASGGDPPAPGLFLTARAGVSLRARAAPIPLRGVRSGTTRQTGFQEGAFLKTAKGGASIRTTGRLGSALRALVLGVTRGPLVRNGLCNTNQLLDPGSHGQ